LEIVIGTGDEMGIVETCVGKNGDLMGFIGIYIPSTNTDPENHSLEEESSLPPANRMVYVRCRDCKNDRIKTNGWMVAMSPNLRLEVAYLCGLPLSSNQPRQKETSWSNFTRMARGVSN